MEQNKAVVLLSGGLDSTTVAWIAKIRDKKYVYPLSFLYGQRHKRELDCAITQAYALGQGSLKILDLPLSEIGGSSLVGQGEIPTKRSDAIKTSFGLAYGHSSDQVVSEIPSTWVPQRNSIFLGVAFAYAEVIEADSIYIGANQLDYSGYPDCRQEFMKAMEISLNLASKRFVEEGRVISVVTPLMNLTKVEIIRVGLELGVNYSKTWSCYQGGDSPCGQCDSCRIRIEAFEDLGLVDPLLGG